MIDKTAQEVRTFLSLTRKLKLYKNLVTRLNMRYIQPSFFNLIHSKIPSDLFCLVNPILYQFYSNTSSTKDFPRFSKNLATSSTPSVFIPRVYITISKHGKLSGIF